MVEPMITRGVPVYQSSLTEGAATRVRPVQEAVIAIDPEEVALLTEAMAVNAKLTSIPRSGRPDDPLNSRTPNLAAGEPVLEAQKLWRATSRNCGRGGCRRAYSVVETIMGQKRTLTAVPRR